MFTIIADLFSEINEPAMALRVGPDNLGLKERAEMM